MHGATIKIIGITFIHTLGTFSLCDSLSHFTPLRGTVLSHEFTNTHEIYLIPSRNTGSLKRRQ